MNSMTLSFYIHNYLISSPSARYYSRYRGTEVKKKKLKKIFFFGVYILSAGDQQLKNKTKLTKIMPGNDTGGCYALACSTSIHLYFQCIFLDHEKTKQKSQRLYPRFTWRNIADRTLGFIRSEIGRQQVRERLWGIHFTGANRNTVTWPLRWKL